MKTYFHITSILFILTVGYFTACSKKITNSNSSLAYNGVKNDSIFTVYKIDSINDYYLIYAKRQKQWFKIVSKKEKPIIYQKRIMVNKDYKFSLHSIWNEKIMINGVNVSPSQTPHVTCLGFDTQTTICLERYSIKDLFSSKNLRGIEYKE